MGMISRVRGRIRSDSFSKFHTIKSEDKIANIGGYKNNFDSIKFDSDLFINMLRSIYS